MVTLSRHYQVPQFTLLYSARESNSVLGCLCCPRKTMCELTKENLKMQLKKGPRSMKLPKPCTTQ